MVVGASRALDGGASSGVVPLTFGRVPALASASPPAERLVRIFHTVLAPPFLDRGYWHVVGIGMRSRRWSRRLGMRQRRVDNLEKTLYESEQKKAASSGARDVF